MVRNGSAGRQPGTNISTEVDVDMQGKYAPSDATLGVRRELSGESTPALSQASDTYFDNPQDFWQQAFAQIEDTQLDTHPTSLSAASVRPASHFDSIGSRFLSKAPLVNETLKRKSSIIAPDESRAIKKTRVESESLPYINLSPIAPLQNKIEARKLPYSVQWELARHMSKGILSWEGSEMSGEKRTITFQDLDALEVPENAKNRNSEGVKKVNERFFSDGETSQFSNRSNEERLATDPWPEFEKEEAFATVDPGFQQINKQGGKIHFTATLKQAADADKKRPTPESYKVELNPAELATGCSFSRRFGSKSFLRLKVPMPLIHADPNLIDFLRKPIILCQAVYRAFYAKEQTAFYFRTNEVWDARGQKICPPASPLSPGLGLKQFLDWHNPIERNLKQTMAKWAARFALGLSSSIHGTILGENEITVIEDTTNDQGSDMTDGAGLITRALLQKLVREHDWSTRPSAIQVRVRGSKGLLVEHPTMDGDKLEIQLRPSLIKIQYPGELDIAQRSIDILRTSHARSPTRISNDVIVNLSENGVPISVIQDLLKNTVENVIKPLLNWDLEDRTVLQELWLSFERSGSVLKARRAREDAALARIDGHTERDTTEDVQEDDEEAQELEGARERSVEWWPDDISGCPSSLEETIMAFLDSGFHPATCAILREKIFSVVRSTVIRTIENFSVDIPLSAIAWIVPDPLGILEPNQLFFRSSIPNLTTLDGTESDIITGDVLITRDPCRLPTDVQKWKAVDVSQLHYLRDVIVLSVKGPRRAADWLAGGDYDGDKAKIFWQPELVKDFRNAAEHFADPPPDLNSYFEIQNERVADFLDRNRLQSEEQQLSQMQKYLLGTMKDQGEVGRYAGFHEASAVMNGYAHETTKLLAYIFTTVLDGRKTGKTIRKEWLHEHQKRFGSKPLGWKEDLRNKSEGSLAPQSNVKPVRTAKGTFILEELVNFGKKLQKKRLGELEQWKKGFEHKRDQELLEPILEVQRMIDENDDTAAALLKEDYERIKVHVENMWKLHRDEMAQLLTNDKKGSPSTTGASFTNLPIQRRQDKLRRLSSNFHAEPTKFKVMSKVTADQIKASYAYSYDLEQGKPTRFSWNVAFRVLCCIKAGNQVKPIHKNFYDYMAIKIPKRRKHYV